MRNQILGNEWNTIDLGQVPDSRGGQVSAVEFVRPPVSGALVVACVYFILYLTSRQDISLEGTMAQCEYPSTDSVATRVAKKESPPD
jgi:hypothetical protein